MSVLAIYPENAPERGERFTDFDSIVERLDNIGVRFERWRADRTLGADATEADILDAYRDSVNRLMKQYNFASADVISIRPDNPEKASIRQKFLAEHTHNDFEVRFFVEGKGLFYLHVEGRVYGVLCEQGDLISVPAGVTHWFDMGENPHLKCIRLFTTPEGWVAAFTGSDIGSRFPSFDDFVAV